MLIQMENMRKIYKMGENHVPALDGVSFSIDKGEFVAIIGESGSGKSTLMNMLGCLDIPNEGSYSLMGLPVFNMCESQICNIRSREIGFVFQGFNLISSLTALENVELPLIYRKIPKSKRKKMAQTALSLVGLSERAGHRPSQLSGGQQQRTAIARAIAAQPPIILADEPTGNLDSSSGAEVMKLLSTLNTHGHTVILITHSPEIASMAQRIINIKDGKITSDKRLIKPHPIQMNV